MANPVYYQLDANGDPIQYVSDLADSVVETLQQHDCVVQQNAVSTVLYIEFVVFNSALQELKGIYEATLLGMLSCQYYLSYKSTHFISENMESNSSIDELLILICQVEEYRLFPVRHNEDNINKFVYFL